MMQNEMHDLAFALAAYRADHGSYPAKLADLSPKYVATSPKDIFNDADLHYRARRRLSALQRRSERQGRRRQELSGDRKTNEDWDDLIIHMPAAVKP